MYCNRIETIKFEACDIFYFDFTKISNILPFRIGGTGGTGSTGRVDNLYSLIQGDEKQVLQRVLMK
mgnify:CR=1 FL=1